VKCRRELPVIGNAVQVGFNHFWHAPSEVHGGDLVYFHGQYSPGNYARAYLEGRLPDFWQFATVSLGIGPITSIYQAQFMKYLQGCCGRAQELADAGAIEATRVQEAIDRYQIDPETAIPTSV